MPDDVLRNGKPTLRHGLLTRLTFQVLRDASEPIRAAEAVRRVESRLDPTPHEASQNKTGIRRWETYVRWTTSWAKTLGWVEKAKGHWSLTQEGQAALDDYPGDELDHQITRRYQATRRTETDEPSSPQAILEQALDTLASGSWTTYGDLAQLTGLASLGIAQAMRSLGHTSAHRVLQADGTISAGFKWFDDSREDGQRAALEDEGLEFDADGHAEHAARITVDDFRELLSIDPPATRAWLIRGNNVSGVDLVPQWLRDGYCSLPASQARNLAPGMDRQEISRVVQTEYADKSYAARGDKINEFDTFLNRMRLDDLVVTISDGRLYLGHITGDASAITSEADRSNLRRAVDWRDRGGNSIDYADVPKALGARLAVQRSLVDLTSERHIIEALLNDDSVISPADPVEPVVPVLAGLTAATDELAEANLVPRDWLQEAIDLLWDRRQMIFYGPPGTGKTYLARQIARHVTGTENVKLVQFHPAYSYEDFFEGYRPSAPTADGRVGFALTPGPFRRLVEAARENPSTPYVLIIDEINRANLAKVFGELYFLLEYRDETIDLLYAFGDEAGFSMPENVFLIGTMNTADRSIALVDAAMRRRFAFVPLHPSQEPTASLLRRWLEREGYESTAGQLLDRLNERIDDPDFKVGPSYLMRADVHRDQAGLDRAWRSDILPLLEEHHYGEDIDVSQRYGLASLRRVQSNRDDEAAPDAVTDTDAG